MRITHWTIKVTWEDGREEYLDDIPYFVAREVDFYLEAVEADAEEDV